MKYLYKYAYKGYDAANIIVEESNNERLINHDEVRGFIDTPYVNPVKACYRILSKPLQCKSHSIIRLAVHLLFIYLFIYLFISRKYLHYIIIYLHVVNLHK